MDPTAAKSASKPVSKPGSKPGTSKPGSDPAHDVLRSERHPLDAIFMPKTVAVIGATERAGSLGRRVLWALLSSPFGGTVFPVSKDRQSVLGIKAYPNIAAVPEPVELAVIVTPAATVPALVTECIESGLRAAVIISAGFREFGPEGAALEQDIKDRLKGSRLRVIGPNCLGVMNPLTGLNATFSQVIARPGNVAFISQSGALCTAILDWSLREMVGFSAFASLGSMLDVDWGDMIDYLGNDPRTQSIVIYMETIGDARSFLSAAREVALNKPIIVIKAGRSEEAARAAASHTGALTGSDEVLQAAFRRVGVLRVNSISDIFYMSEVLSKQPRPKGPNLMILTNAGGPGVLAADGVMASGGKLAKLSPQSMQALNAFLPPHWSQGNPIDILGDAGPDRYAKALEIAVKDPNCEGILVLTAPQGLTEPTQTAELMKPYAHSTGKPVLACFMGGAEVAAANEILNRAGIPTFQFPDTATRAFTYMWRYSYNLRGLYETPVLRAEREESCDRAITRSLIEEVRKSGRALLSEFESKQLLNAYGIRTVETCLAKSLDQAVSFAEELGYPVVLKLHSHTVTHKARVGGVQLDLRNPEDVRAAYAAIESSVRASCGDGHFLGVTVQPMVSLDGFELILGSSIDPQFGPVLLFGSGGRLVEVLKDRALALPPLNTTLARRMMEQTRIFKALQEYEENGRKLDLVKLEDLLVDFSQLVTEHAWIREIDINPLLVTTDSMIALDARIVLHDSSTREEDLPRPAIRPYPSQQVGTWTMKSGATLTIRPIRPEDEPLMIRFHEHLSDRTVYLRYFQPLKLTQRTAHERLTRICFIDYDREMALVAEHEGPEGPEIIGVGRLSKLHGTDEAECAVLVRDDYQHQGIGTELVRRCLLIAKQEKLKHVHSTMLGINREMRAICNRLGFRLHVDLEDDLVHARVQIS